MQALSEVGDMLRRVFRITKVCDEESSGLTIEDVGERLLPHRKINIRGRSRGHDVWPVGDADSGGIAGERHALSLLKIGEVVRGVARSINNVDLSRAHGKSFSAVEGLNILLPDRQCFAE